VPKRSEESEWFRIPGLLELLEKKPRAIADGSGFLLRGFQGEFEFFIPVRIDQRHFFPPPEIFPQRRGESER
jgi:hypothetical protein